MNKNRENLRQSMRLYAVTDRSWLSDQTLYSQVEQALQSGVTFLQLREKELETASFLKEAAEIKKLANAYQIPFVINDNIEVALACGADGVHVGQSDMEAKDVRKLLGDDKILGVSVQTVEQALKAEHNGADYLGVGAVFNTSTKLDANHVSYDVLKKICDSVSIPVVAIGGISSETLLQLKGSGIDGVAVVSAIFAQKDIPAATKKLRSLAEEATAR